VARLERANGYKVDVLLVCGDFQAVRNEVDLGCMAVPVKYRRLGGFYRCVAGAGTGVGAYAGACRYYVGEKTAPVLTLVVGGNHEAANYMWEL